MMKDLVNTERELVGDQIGSYNRKFAEKWEKSYIKAFGKDASLVDKMSAKQITTVLQQFTTKVNESIGTLG